MRDSTTFKHINRLSIHETSFKDPCFSLDNGNTYFLKIAVKYFLQDFKLKESKIGMSNFKEVRFCFPFNVSIHWKYICFKIILTHSSYVVLFFDRSEKMVILDELSQLCTINMKRIVHICAAEALPNKLLFLFISECRQY